jgi:hypothetical protein
MHLIAGRTLDRILILDRQHLERLRVHRKARINQLARFWALNQYAVHSSSEGLGLMSPLQIKVRCIRRFRTLGRRARLLGALDQRLHLNRLVGRRHRVGYDQVIGAGAGEIVAQSSL